MSNFSKQPQPQLTVRWGKDSQKTSVTTKNSDWCLKFKHVSEDDCQVSFKAGNKTYSLNNSTESNVYPDRVIASEAGLFRKTG